MENLIIFDFSRQKKSNDIINFVKSFVIHPHITENKINLMDFKPKNKKFPLSGKKSGS
jgi:hypothetical protein